MGSWEDALDVDDSDLPSLLRPSTLLPCRNRLPEHKHHHQQQQQQKNQPNNKNNSSQTILLFLQPCSQIPCPSQPLTSSPKTLDSQSDQIPLQFGDKEQESPKNSSRRLIPGPAAAVQAAMHRKIVKDRDGACFSGRSSTEDNLRREEDDDLSDEDFKQNPWLCAMELLDFSLGSPIISIKSGQSGDRVPQVVGMIKSCRRNELGDLIVTLKDPTGVIGGSIHSKVLRESEFGKDISVGSVVILKQVVVFSPSHSTHYLNITLRNVVKVISKDSGPIPKQTVSAVTVSCAASEEQRETRKGVTKKATLATEPGVANEIVRRDNNAGKEVDNRHVGGPTGTFGSSSSSVRCQGIDTNNLVEEPKHVTHDRENGEKKLIPKVSLTGWTDEQLNELFADCEDNTCLLGPGI